MLEIPCFKVTEIESHIDSFESPLVDCRIADNPCSRVTVGFEWQCL